ncbi:MAG: hypothetical protein UR12_C0010G0009 [candidate division TM6 bacterium GW2011_GWF2_30_66]|jgi:hypothetical protein|nr:MAG: hypothetical protein UR12_C0010G0009 [candidate division TM6 bacterium GW2011_GWF2_30_66]
MGKNFIIFVFLVIALNNSFMFAMQDIIGSNLFMNRSGKKDTCAMTTEPVERINLDNFRNSVLLRSFGANFFNKKKIKDFAKKTELKFFENCDKLPLFIMANNSKSELKFLKKDNFRQELYKVLEKFAESSLLEESKTSPFQDNLYSWKLASFFIFFNILVFSNYFPESDMILLAKCLTPISSFLLLRYLALKKNVENNNIVYGQSSSEFCKKFELEKNMLRKIIILDGHQDV